MKKKTRVILTTVIGLLLLMAVAAAGLNAVFTVTLVSTEFSLLTEEGSRDAAALKEKLDGYVGKSTTFLSLRSLEKEVEKYACFRLDSIGKSYPSTVELRISERREYFAVAQEGGYAVFDEDGYCMYKSEENCNRGGGENILLEGFSLSADVGSYLQGAFVRELLTMFEVFDEQFLSAPRANILSVTLENHPGYSLFSIRMREGVTIEIVDPDEYPAEKAYAALNDEFGGYFSLDERALSGGTISVVSSGETILVDYDFYGP